MSSTAKNIVFIRCGESKREPTCSIYPSELNRVLDKRAVSRYFFLY